MKWQRVCRDTPVILAIAGRHASWLPGEDWATNLGLPVDEVRRQLAIKPPAEYREVLTTVQAAAA